MEKKKFQKVLLKNIPR